MLRMNYTRLCNKEHEVEYKRAFGDITDYPLNLNGGGRQQNTKIKTYIYAELLLFTAYKVYNREFTLDELLVLFSGIHTNFIDVDADVDKFIIQAHTFLSSHDDEWNKRSIITHFYFKQKDHNTKLLQLFKVDGNLIKDKYAKIYFNKDIYGFKDRVEKYTTVLTDPKYIRLISMSGDSIIPILSDFIEKRIKQKQKYDVYSKVTESLESIDSNFVELMGKHYPQNYKLIKLKEINKPSPALSHIAGKTGHGKSILFDIYIKKLTESGLKVLYVTDTHAPNSINTKLRLDDLNIKTTIIMGKNRSEHIDKFIYSQEGKSIPELILQYPDLFSNIDYTCYNVETLNCRKCTLDNKCSFYEMYGRLPKTDVVITTPYNLLDSVANVRVDEFRRSIYEILNLWADVILLDEADKLQVIGDDRLISSTEVYSLDTIERSNKEHLEGLLKILYNGITRSNIVENENVKKFKTIVNKYDREVDLLQVLFFNPEGKGLIRKLYGGKNFTIRQLIYDWSSKYISSIIHCSGTSPELDLSQYNNRFYALLLYRIENIRRNYVDFLLEKYESDEIEISSIFNDIFENYRKNVCTLELTEEEKSDFSLQDTEIHDNNIKINFKHLNEDKKIERNEILTFILLLSSIDNYLNRIYDIIKPILDTLSTDHNYINIATNADNHLLAPKSMIKDADGFRIDIDYKGTKLIKNSYRGIGREILFENPRIVARLYDIQPPYMLFASATSAGTKSSKYNIKYPVNQLLIREGTESSKINIKCHVFYKNQSPLKISGVDFNQQSLALKDLTNEITKNLIPLILKESASGILISTSSYTNANIILEELLKAKINAKVSYHESMGEYDPNVHITKLDIEKKSSEVAVFIGVNVVMERGFNILDIDGKSYFKNIIVMNRSLPSPKDILEKISYFHKELNAPLSSISYREIKRNMYKTHTALRHLKGFKNAPQYIQESIAGNTLVSLKQLSGRGQRGGTDVSIHIVDSAFYPITAEKSLTDSLDTIIDSKNSSLFIAWQDMLNTGDTLVDYLYDDLKCALNHYELILHKDYSY
jgi:hypothetical protein